MSDICNLCGKVATLMCQRCSETYCSTNCQILDWRVHKKVCYPMPTLVPIKEFIKDASSVVNHSLGSETSRNRIPNDKNVKRSLARNPLKIPPDDKLPVQAIELKSPEIKNHTDVDFTLKPKLVPKENEIKSNVSQCSKVSTRNAAWRTPYRYPEGKFFDVIVQYVEEGNAAGVVWVTDLKYEGPLRKLLAEINRNIDINTDRCSGEEIRVGSLIAAPFENLYYRAEIVEVIQTSKMVVVHLIDYGNLVEVSFKDLRSPIPIMRNLNAYAFRIRYPKPVALEVVLTIRVVDVDANGVANIEEKTADIKPMPVGLTAESFATSTTVTLVKISDNGNYALLCLSNEAIINQLQEMNSFLNTDASTELLLETPPNDGDYVAACTLHGWARALLMSTYRKDYLVYLFDVGRVALVEKVLTIPDKFKSIPMQVFAIELQKILSEGNNFTDCLLHDKILTIKAQKSAKTRNDRISCYIVANDGAKIAEVEAFNYVGKCEEIGVKDWVEPLISGSTVHVTNVVSHFEIFISLVCTKMYPKIFSAAAEDCESIPSGKCVKGDLILAKYENEYFRARILEAAKTDDIKVLNVDTGAVLTVSVQTMRKPNIFVLSCPYHTRKVKLMYLSNVATPYTDNKALAMLEQCQQKGAEFILKFESNPELGVELLLRTADQQSMNKQLLPLLFEKRTDSVKENEKKCAVIEKPGYLPTTPPPSPKVEDQPGKKIYTLKDLEIIPITCGENVPVMVLDNSTISKGYISGCDFTNRDFLKKLESEYLPMVAKYCASLSNHTEYSPGIDEICLAVYDVDKDWYRALCLNQMKDDMFYVMFLDYGNMCRVHKSNIRQITSELMFPSNANMCIFEGIPEELPPQMCEKFISATQADPKIIAKVTKLEQDSYLLKINNMDKYF